MKKLNSPSAALIKKIYQLDNYNFIIEWSDHTKNQYRLSDLQNLCPCANCVDENSGQRTSIKNSNTEISAVKIVNVGRYALRIQFKSGCSTGIYSYEMLRNL